MAVTISIHFDHRAGGSKRVGFSRRLKLWNQIVDAAGNTTLTSDDLRSTERELSGRAGPIFCRTLMPRAQPHARLVILHGYGDHSGRYVHFMSWMAQRGVACHTFDFRGHGRSAGKRGYVARWHDFIDDFHTFLREGELASLDAPLLVLGHSHGALVLAAAVIDGLNHVAGCILSSPFFKRCFSIPWHRNVLGQLCSRIIPAQPFKSVLQPEWLCHDAQMIEDTRRDPLGLRIATPRW